MQYTGLNVKVSFADTETDSAFSAILTRTLNRYKRQKCCQEEKEGKLIGLEHIFGSIIVKC